MARINIDDKWLIDPRRISLISKIGMFVADGVAYQFWRLSQDYKDGIIPIDIYELCGHWKEFEEVGLAVRKENGIYIRGASNHFEWLEKKKMSGRIGGLASGKQRQANAKKVEAKRSKPKHVLESGLPFEPSISISNSISNTFTNVNGVQKNANSFVSRIQKNFLGNWSAKYQASYQGFSYAKSGALLKRLEKEYSAAPEKVEGAIANFFSTDDQFVVNSRHSFEVFMTTINRWLVAKKETNSFLESAR